MAKARGRLPANHPPRQLDLPLENIECPHYGNCASPLCPKDIYCGNKAWFPDEPVCRLRCAPDWVRKQRQIVRLPGIDPSRYFTLRMLNTIKQVSRGLQGANPDLVTAERIWFTGQRGIARTKKEKRPSPPTRDTGETSQGNERKYRLF